MLFCSAKPDLGIRFHHWVCCIFMVTWISLLFVAEHIDYFRFNSEIHGFNTKSKYNLHLPPTKLTIYQRGPCYSGIKAFNNLPTYIKNLLQTKNQFKQALNEFLHSHSYYSLNDFYNHNKC